MWRQLIAGTSMITSVLLAGATAAPSASAVTCGSAFHALGYASDYVYGGTSGWIYPISQPTLNDTTNYATAEWIGEADYGSALCGTASCWLQAGLLRGTATNGHFHTNWIYVERNSLEDPYPNGAQSVGVRQAPAGDIFVMNYQAGVSNGHPYWWEFYKVPNDPLPIFMAGATQYTYSGYEEADVEIHGLAGHQCLRIGQVNFGFNTSNHLDQMYGLSNSTLPESNYSWSLWTGPSQFTGPQGCGAWSIFLWQQYWSFTVNDTPNTC